MTAKKDQRVDWATQHLHRLKGPTLNATATPGACLVEEIGLDIEALKGGLLESDAQIGAMLGVA